LVLVIHEGGVIQGGPNDASCPGLSGDIVPILNKLDTGFDVVVSGHTHRAYACDYKRINPSKPFLLTSAGQYGTFLTHIQLSIDPISKTVQNKTASNVIVQSEAFVNASGIQVKPSSALPFFGKQMDVEKIVNDYRKASEVQVLKEVGRLSTSITRNASPSGESGLGNLIADAQWSSTASAERGRSDFALMNPGGVRADILIQQGVGTVNFGQLFKVQPFGNTLVVKRMTGQQVKDLLEHQFENLDRPKVLFPSEGLKYEVDRRQPKGQRVQNIQIGQKPVDLARTYNVTMNSFLASGGDGFWHFNQAPTVSGGELDVECCELAQTLLSNEFVTQIFYASGLLISRLSIMRQWQQTQRKKARIEIIPMIDVMMFLLVFFVLISVNVIPALGIKTQQPNSSQVQQLRTKDVQVVVTLGKENVIQVDGKDVELKDLSAAVKRKAGTAEQIAVIVNSDKGAEVQTLVDVMDEIKKSGLGKVSLAARERQ
jgi:biopolymer transport protein ExbD